MAFKLIESSLKDLLIIKPDRFGDKRGFFMELYNQSSFEALGLKDPHFFQDNLSFSSKGIVRGLHFQAPPHAQGKLVTTLQGIVLDVVVDIRAGSPTYGQSQSFVLDAEDPTMIFVPKGFAHGFQVLSDTAMFFYKVTDPYMPQAEGGLLWNDPALNIDWHDIPPLVSPKDEVLPGIAAFKTPFV